MFKCFWFAAFQLERMCCQFHTRLWYNTGFNLNGSQWKLSQLIKSLNRSIVCSYVSVCVADVHLICSPVSAHKELLPASVHQNKGSRGRKVRTITLLSAWQAESLIGPQWADILMAAALIPSLTFSLFLLCQMLSGEYFHKYLIPATEAQSKMNIFCHKDNVLHVFGTARQQHVLCAVIIHPCKKVPLQ